MLEGTDYLQFAAAAALWLLALVPALGWLVWRAWLKKREAAEAFTSVTLASRLTLGSLRASYLLRMVLLVVAFGLVVLAAARPRLGTKLERVERTGADILVAIDTSDSMLAEDASPSRLEAAKREVQGLIARLRGDRIGILTFSSEAFLYCPLTADHDAAAMFLSSIDESITSGAGTALAAALRESARAFEAGEGSERAVVLVSDGEDWGEGATEAAQELRASGVKIHAIGIGTEDGAPVPVLDETGEVVNSMREDGKVIVTRLNEKALKDVVAAGDGKYYQGGAADHGAAAVYAQVSAAENRRAGYHTFKSYAERFQWPLGAALLLIAAEIAIRVWPRRRRPRTGLAAAALLCFLTMSGFSFFQTTAALCKAANRLFEEGKFGQALERYAKALDMDPDNPVLQFNAGDALYRDGKYEEARERFGKVGAARDRRLAGASHFNSGNSHLQEGKLDKAIEEYKKALRINPSDPAAKRNLELARKKKQEQPQQDKQEGDDEDQQDQQDQQQSEDQQDKQDQQPQNQDEQDADEQDADEQEQDAQEQQSAPMTPEEARALLRQAEYEDAELRREIVRTMPKPQKSTGKNW